MTRYSLYMLLVVLLPGRAIWRLVVAGGWPDRRTKIVPAELELWVCGAAAGYVLELISYVTARSLNHPQWFVLMPTLVLALDLYVRRLRAGRVSSDPLVRSLPPRVAWATAAIVTYLVLWISIRLFAVHPLRASTLVDPDEMFQLALVGELRHHFPPVYPYMEYPGPLTYQWFVHAHMAASTWATGMSSELVYRRFDPLLLTVLGALGVGIVALRLCRTMWSLPIAVGLLVLIGSFDVTGSTAGEAAPEERFLQALILMHSPTQTYAYVLATPVVLLSLEMLRPESRPRRVVWLPVALGMAALSGAKVTFVPLYLCGFLLVTVISCIRRKRHDVIVALVGASLCVAVSLVAAAVMYGGEAHSLRWAPGQATHFYMSALGISGGGSLGVLIVTLSLLSMWLLPGVGAIGLAVRHRTRWDPRAWWLLGAVGAGYGANMLLGHVGNSEVYFGRAASISVVVLSTWGITEVYLGASRRTIGTAGVLAVAAGVLMLAVRLTTEQWRAPSPLNGESVESPVLRVWINLPVIVLLGLLAYALRLALPGLSRGRLRLHLRDFLVFLLGLGLARSFAFVTGHGPAHQDASSALTYGRDGRAAALWLRAHSNPEERVLTNAHCGPGHYIGGKCDSRHFWMSGISERRFVLEGWAYTGRSREWIGPFWGSSSFLRRNDEVFEAPTQHRLDSFRRQHPANWMFLDRRLDPDLAGLDGLKGVHPVWSHGNYVVYRLDPVSAS